MEPLCDVENEYSEKSFFCHCSFLLLNFDRVALERDLSNEDNNSL